MAVAFASPLHLNEDDTCRENAAMSSASSDSQWASRIAKFAKTGHHDPVFTENLDDLLRWLLNKNSATSALLDRAFDSAGITPRLARRRVLSVVDQMLFKRSNEPWQVLGLESKAQKDEVRDRYKRLTQVFHPDKGLGDERWLNDRMERIRGAYDELQNPTRQRKPNIHVRPNPEHTKPAASQRRKTDTAVTNRRKARSRARAVRRVFGDAAQFRRRILLWMGAGLVFYVAVMVAAVVYE